MTSNPAIPESNEQHTHTEDPNKEGFLPVLASIDTCEDSTINSAKFTKQSLTSALYQAVNVGNEDHVSTLIANGAQIQHIVGKQV